MRASRRAVVVLLALALAATGPALVGCGVPSATSERLARSQVPSGLLDPAPPGGPSGGERPEETAGAGAGAGAGATAALLADREPSTYLLDAQDALVAVPLGRPRATAGPAPASPDAGAADEEATVLATMLLRRLAESPAPAQRDRGLSTALEPGVPVTLVDVVDGTARVALSQPNRDPAANRLPLATGQVVLTVTSAPGVERVQLLRDGEPTAVPLPSGVRRDAPVRALDYAVLLDPAR